MLGVFQQVVKDIGNNDVGELATFDLMFAGIEATLKPFITGSLYKATNNLNNLFAIRVLKSLLLVKYIKGFNATPRNLRVLLQETFTQDVSKLRKDIEEALNLLEQQTYIQRNGEIYEYLTDDEKDIEEEIKNTDVDSGDVAEALDEILFTEIIRDRKIRYDVTGQDYPFTKKLDDKINGREHELTIHFITPFSENVDNIEILTANSLGRAELMVVMPSDSRLVFDLLHYKKTDKYIRLSRSNKQKESVLSILDSKARQNTDRMKLVQDRVRELITRSRFFVAGTVIEVTGDDPKTRLVKGFNQLIIRTYPNLSMLKETQYDENDIKKYLKISEGSLLIDSITEPEQEMLAFILSNKSVGQRTTMKGIEEKFTKKPYGWYLAAIQCLVAMLLGRGKIEARSDSNILEGAVLEQALRNTYSFGNVIIDPQIAPPTSELRRVKEFYNNFFDKPTSMNEAKDLGVEVRNAFQQTLSDLKELYSQKSLYPFLSELDKPIKAIQELAGKDYSFYFSELPKQENSLLDMKENVIDPIRAFMMGSNKTIYDEASQFLHTQGPNFSGIGSEKPGQLNAIIEAPDCFKGNKMREAKTLLDGLKKEIDKQLKLEKENGLKKVSQLQTRIKAMDEYGKLKESQKKEIDQSFEAIVTYVHGQNIIAVIRDQIGQYETKEYNRLLTSITDWTKKDKEKSIEYVSQTELDMKFDLPYIASEEDIENYLQALKKALLKAIKANKRIRL